MTSCITCDTACVSRYRRILHFTFYWSIAQAVFYMLHYYKIEGLNSQIFTNSLELPTNLTSWITIVIMHCIEKILWYSKIHVSQIISLFHYWTKLNHAIIDAKCNNALCTLLSSKPQGLRQVYGPYTYIQQLCVLTSNG